MTARGGAAILGNAKKLSEALGNGGWRQHVPSAYARQYDATVAGGQELLDAALAGYDSETPTGWAAKLRAWAQLQRGPNGSYGDLMTAATSAMVIDLHDAQQRGRVVCRVCHRPLTAHTKEDRIVCMRSEPVELDTVDNPPPVTRPRPVTPPPEPAPPVALPPEAEWQRIDLGHGALLLIAAPTYDRHADRIDWLVRWARKVFA